MFFGQGLDKQGDDIPFAGAWWAGFIEHCHGWGGHAVHVIRGDAPFGRGCGLRLVESDFGGPDFVFFLADIDVVTGNFGVGFRAEDICVDKGEMGDIEEVFDSAQGGAFHQHRSAIHKATVRGFCLWDCEQVAIGGAECCPDVAIAQDDR